MRLKIKNLKGKTSLLPQVLMPAPALLQARCGMLTCSGFSPAHKHAAGYSQGRTSRSGGFTDRGTKAANVALSLPFGVTGAELMCVRNGALITLPSWQSMAISVAPQPAGSQQAVCWPVEKPV